MKSYIDETYSAFLLKLFEKCSLNEKFIAKKIGMPRNTLHDKLNPKRTSRFTKQEYNKICGVLIYIRHELKAIKTI